MDPKRDAFSFDALCEEAAQLTAGERGARDTFSHQLERRKFGTRFHSDDYADVMEEEP